MSYYPVPSTYVSTNTACLTISAFNAFSLFGAAKGYDKIVFEAEGKYFPVPVTNFGDWVTVSMNYPDHPINVDIENDQKQKLILNIKAITDH